MHLIAFAGVSLLLAVTPGPDFALVTRNALAFGRRGTLLTCAGLACALLLWVAASAVGVVALLKASRALYAALKTAGGVYLAYLGVQSLWSSRDRAHRAPDSETARQPDAPSAPGIWRQGFLSALLNPKLGVFFVTFLPQFVDQNGPVAGQIAGLGAIFTAIGISWMTIYGLFVVRLRDVVMSTAARRWMNGITGFVLVVLGVSLIATR